MEVRPGDKVKRSIFQAVVVSMLQYGCTTWTLNKCMEKKFDGNYTKMLRALLNKSWRQHPTKQQLHGHRPFITKIFQVRQTSKRSKDEFMSDILLWTASRGRAKVGRPDRTYIQQLWADTGCSLENFPGVMDDKDGRRERVREIRASRTTYLSICVLGTNLSVWEEPINLLLHISLSIYLSLFKSIYLYIVTMKYNTFIYTRRQ